MMKDEPAVCDGAALTPEGAAQASMFTQVWLATLKAATSRPTPDTASAITREASRLTGEDVVESGHFACREGFVEPANGVDLGHGAASRRGDGSGCG